MPDVTMTANYEGSPERGEVAEEHDLTATYTEFGDQAVNVVAVVGLDGQVVGAMAAHIDLANPGNSYALQQGEDAWQIAR